MDKEANKKYQREWMRRYRAKKKANLSAKELQALEERTLKSRFKKGTIPWNKGKKGVMAIPWNKGLTKETDERVAKNSAATSIGVKLLWKQPDYKGGNKKGVKFDLSPEQRKAYSDRVSGRNNPMYGKGGDKSPVWKGGISFEPYPPKFNSKLKEKVKLRDNYTCQFCGTEEQLAIHHIDYIKENCDISNLITLCFACNAMANCDRSIWEKHFSR